MIAVARTQGALEELDDEIRKGGGSATLVPLNLTDSDGIARLGAGLHERYGKLDILVGHAAKVSIRSIHPSPKEQANQRPRTGSAKPAHQLLCLRVRRE